MEKVSPNLEAMIAFCSKVTELLKQRTALKQRGIPRLQVTRTERRTVPDRRSYIAGCIPLRRLRKGMWITFTLRTGLGEFQLIELTDSLLVKIHEELGKELRRYRFVSKSTGMTVSAEKALERAIVNICTRRGAGHVWKPVYLTEAIAQHLNDNFCIFSADRRIVNERRKRAALLELDYTLEPS
ncbi:MAG: hypothetical protein OEZ47_13455 [Gammaproteobacteria bacterium]|nr:hypothetical protein [Gammaproteobacteria bacterium]